MSTKTLSAKVDSVCEVAIDKIAKCWDFGRQPLCPQAYVTGFFQV